jgi:bifunctional DNase/RNase
MLVEVKVVKLGLDKTENVPVVILQEVEGERVLPIWIGPSEAKAIYFEYHNKPFPRPLTHQLLHTIMGGLGGTLDRIVISKEVEKTYFAELIVRRGEEVISVDARPSDSIAVALRAGASIFADDGLLLLVSVEIAEEDDTAVDHLVQMQHEVREKSEGLRDYLRKLNPEDFGRFAP